MSTLATTRAGRVLLHMLCMLRDREFTFHSAGIKREIWRT